MRALVAGLMILGFITSPVMAENSGAGDNSGAPTDKTGTASATTNARNTPATAKAVPPAKPGKATTEDEMQELRDLLEAQATQLREQNQQLQEEQAQIGLLKKQLIEFNLSNASIAVIAPSSASPSSSAVNGAVASGIPAKIPDPAVDEDQPASIRFKGITLTPGGYMAAETVWRNRSIGSGINSAFNSVPLPGNEQSHISEFNASGRQSRISMLAEGKLKTVKIGGYYEGDFLSAGTTSNDNQSNSYTFRQRQFWGQAKFDNGWTVTGGQMWSLVTETKSGVDNRSEATTQTIDAQYNVGFSWARQYGLRIAKDFSDKVWLAASVEQAQTTLTAHGQNNNFVVGSFGVGGGLFNPIANYAYNAAPDFIVKAAFQPGWGHYEIFGILTTARDRVYPCETASATTACGGVTGPSGALAYNDTRNGGGLGANARARFFKHLDLGLHFLGGDGIGRYGSVGLPQATVRPNGTLALIRNYQSLGTIEIFTNKLDVYAYVGDEYSARAAYTVGSKGIGYGSPLFVNSGCWTEPIPGSSTSTATGVGGSAGFVPGTLANCTADTKSEVEGTLGFWYRFYKGPKGTVQLGIQESYFLRNTWSGIGTASGVGSSGAPHGTDNMVFTSFRYYLP